MTSVSNNDKKLKLSENLWEGFDLLVKRTDTDLAQSRNILVYFKKKAELEEQHSKKLEKLTQKMAATLDENNGENSISYYQGWRKMINSCQLESEQHTLINTNILNKIIQPFQAMIKDLELKRKKVVSEGVKLRHDMKEMVEALKKSQSKYDRSCKELEQACLDVKELKESSTGSDSELSNISKLEKKIQRLEMEERVADDEYKEQIKATNDFQHFYNTEAMPKIFNDFEHFILSHSHLSKTYFNNWTNILTEQPNAYKVNYDGVKKFVDMMDKDRDLQEFIRKNQMKKVLTEPYKYEAYVKGKLQPKKASKINQLFSMSTIRGTGGGSGSNNSISSSPSSGSKLEVILPTASFCVPIDDLMNRQKDTHPQLEVPRVLVVLAENITHLKGHVTEGIFRVPGIISIINETKLKLDQANFDLSSVDDVRTSAALLKRWLRDIPDPIIPMNLHKQATEAPATALEIIKKIPVSSQKVLTYLINMIQIFVKLEFVAHSKMGVSNMAMIFAPTILRCPSNDPNVLLNNVGPERLFVETLIKNITPPKDFMGLPVSMSDAILDGADDIEELNNETDDSGNEQDLESTYAVESTHIADPRPISPTPITKQPEETVSSPTAATPTISSTPTPATPATESIGSSNPTSPISSPPLSGFSSPDSPKAPKQSGWVRVKPASAGVGQNRNDQ